MINFVFFRSFRIPLIFFDYNIINISLKSLNKGEKNKRKNKSRGCWF